MRRGSPGLGGALLACALLTGAASADEPAGGATKSADEADAASKQHMTNGVKLFNDRNYAAARAEFEAAYQARPRASPLLNIALCDKAMFRYPRAIAALERALGDHRATMDEADQRSAAAAITEMRALLAHVEVTVTPREAELRVDGEVVAAGAAAQPIALGPGQHRIEARLPGHRTASEAVTLASGDRRAVTLVLTADQGRLVVRAPDRGIAIAIDQTGVAYGEWSGFLAPGAHLVQLYRPGEAPVTTQVLVVAGSTVEVAPQLWKAQVAPRDPVHRGPYGLAAVTVFLPGEPADFSGFAAGASAGVRLGYRLTSLLLGEASFDYASVAVTGRGSDGAELSYALSSLRFGLHARLMSKGDRIRFTGTLGAGVMYDSVDWRKNARPSASGVNGFAAAEEGFELDFDGVLVGLTAQQILASSGGLDAGKVRTFSGAQVGVGAGLRIGYHLW